MNTTYTLIKLPDNFILCEGDDFHNKNLMAGDLAWHRKIKEVGKVTFYNSVSGDWQFETLSGNTSHRDSYKLFKVIASLHKISEGVPTLTFDEVVAREIGYVDMLKKCNEIYDMHPNNIEVYGDSESKNTYQAGVWDGYLQAIEDNKDKVYTKDDFLLFALSLFGHIQRNPKSVTENIKEFVINYTLPTKWQVQITNNSDNSITVNKIV